MALYIGYEPVGQEFESLRAHHKNQALTVNRRKGFFVGNRNWATIGQPLEEQKVKILNRMPPSAYGVAESQSRQSP